ncbi:Frataxin [Stereum hirsutum FP-91666 SS1]|uniref:Frataxin n=1 Tax=Stereum hirsutum (strain FP-91666) TaxID=721885 RepID=UPI0004409F25|nr:Frataxin [Stereum hirsutum FP-91666 SS1]EIM92790.1 Frataxin [Stereum hirsutum FP-91666 SS1]
MFRPSTINTSSIFHSLADKPIRPCSRRLHTSVGLSAKSTRLCTVRKNTSYASREDIACTSRAATLPHPPSDTHLRESQRRCNLTTDQYNELSDATMDAMLDSLEALVDESGQQEYEIEYNSGVLTLKLGSHGTYVINKQPPNKQIWLSSPLSGPKRYDYVPTQDDWIYSRDNTSLSTLLDKELSDVFGKEVKLGLEETSKLVP